MAESRAVFVGLVNPKQSSSCDPVFFFSASNTSGMVEEFALLLIQVGNEPPGKVKAGFVFSVIP